MTAHAAVAPDPRRTGWRPHLASSGWSALLLLLAAFAIRLVWFGDPVAHVDEEFYLLVGDRMLHGAVPFVDIWDRKPIGLFLIYAGIRLLGGGGVLQYQVVATLFVWATALVVQRLAARIARPLAATIAALCYLLWPALLEGYGGQTPVFYNLPVTLAAALVLRAVVDERQPRRIVALGAAAMLLTGIAIQIKYTAVFEGMFFGCALLWALWRRAAPAQRPVIIAATALWITLALLPTALALGWYAGHGHGQAFFFANFQSIGGRGLVSAGVLAGRLRNMGYALFPLIVTLVVALAGKSESATDARVGARRFLLAWLAAAVAGVLAFGTFYIHYALPLLPPLCAAIAPAFDRRRAWALAAPVLLFGIGGNVHAFLRQRARLGDAAYAARLVAMIRPNLHGGCLFVYEGEPILYHLTGACIPTRYAFPSHLNERLEADAIGADPVAEVRAALATRPAVIVDAVDKPRKHRHRSWSHPGDNPRTGALVSAELARNYRLVGHADLLRDVRRVWVRLPGR